MDKWITQTFNAQAVAMDITCLKEYVCHYQQVCQTVFKEQQVLVLSAQQDII